MVNEGQKLDIDNIVSLSFAHYDILSYTFSFLLSCKQKVVIKLADFGFAKIDRGDLVTPQFTPYYVSPQVWQLCNFLILIPV